MVDGLRHLTGVVDSATVPISGLVTTTHNYYLASEPHTVVAGMTNGFRVDVGRTGRDGG